MTEGLPIQVELGRAVVTVVPVTIKTEQCYWDSGAGTVSATNVDVFGSAGTASSSKYDRFFRATCRVAGGYVLGCTWNFQGR